MPDARPKPVGHYEVMEDFVTPQASIRIIRMRGEGMEVETHVHHRTTQIYVALEGRVGVVRDGIEVVLEPYAAMTVPVGREHGARPIDGEAIVMNISVPPLAVDDLAPMAVVTKSADFKLPENEDQVDD